MTFGLVLLILGGFLLGGAISIWRLEPDTETDTGRRTGGQVLFAVLLLLAAALATVAGILWLVGAD